MTKTSGLGDNFYVDGRDLSGDVGSLGTVGGGPAVLDVTGMDKFAFERIGGLRVGTMEYTAFFNNALGQEHATLSTLPRGDRTLTYCRGTVIGNAAACLISKQIDYAPTRGNDGAFTIAGSHQSNGYGLEWGELLTAGKRIDTTATNGASWDGLAATSFGLQAYLHVFALTGTNVVVTLEDSANNSTFAAVTAGAFTSATAIGAQRIQTGRTAAVRRYVRAVTTGTFTSATFAVVLVRNPIAVSF